MVRQVWFVACIHRKGAHFAPFRANFTLIFRCLRCLVVGERIVDLLDQALHHSWKSLRKVDKSDWRQEYWRKADKGSKLSNPESRANHSLTQVVHKYLVV